MADDNMLRIEIVDDDAHAPTTPPPIPEAPPPAMAQYTMPRLPATSPFTSVPTASAWQRQSTASTAMALTGPPLSPPPPLPPVASGLPTPAAGGPLLPTATTTHGPSAYGLPILPVRIMGPLPLPVTALGLTLPSSAPVPATTATTIPPPQPRTEARERQLQEPKSPTWVEVISRTISPILASTLASWERVFRPAAALPVRPDPMQPAAPVPTPPAAAAPALSAFTIGQATITVQQATMTGLPGMGTPPPSGVQTPSWENRLPRVGATPASAPATPPPAAPLASSPSPATPPPIPPPIAKETSAPWLARLTEAAGPTGLTLLALSSSAKLLASGIDATTAGVRRMGDAAVAAAGNDNLGALTRAADAGAAALGKIPVVGSVLESSLKAASSTVRSFDAVATAFVERGRQLAGYSPDLARAGATADIRSTLADINEAQTLGPALSRLIDAQSQVDTDFRELLLPIKEVVVGELAKIMQGVGDFLRFLKPGMAQLAKMLHDMDPEQQKLERQQYMRMLEQQTDSASAGVLALAKIYDFIVGAADTKVPKYDPMKTIDDFMDQAPRGFGKPPKIPDQQFGPNPPAFNLP